MGTIPTHVIEQVASATRHRGGNRLLFSAQACWRELSRALSVSSGEDAVVSTSTRRGNRFHCFGCGVGGSVFRFVMDYEHIDFPASG